MYYNASTWQYNSVWPLVTLCPDSLHAVHLRKAGSGLGLTVFGGSDVHEDPLFCVVRVRKLFPLGPAAQSGHIHVGDVILEVNGTPTTGLTRNVSET